MTRQAFTIIMRAVMHAFALGAAALVLLITLSPSSAFDPSSSYVEPMVMPAAIIAQREAANPKLTNALLAGYVERQRKLREFDGFDVFIEPQLTSALLSSYISKQYNPALAAIDGLSEESAPALTADVLASYVENGFQPTSKKVKLADDERLCLTQAIYHEARGEGTDGQLAVANIIINRAMSKRYPTTICGVVFQNADKGRYRCQFTFACDGKSDFGTERRAWARAEQIADQAFAEFQHGDRPNVIPSNALFYHTTSVSPDWSHRFRRVAAIGSHLFYAPAN